MDNGNFNASNSLVEVLDNDEEDSFPNLVNHSYYCTEKDLLNAITSSNGLSIYTLNCQSLFAKFNEFCIFLNTLEHKLQITVISKITQIYMNRIFLSIPIKLILVKLS